MGTSQKKTGEIERGPLKGMEVFWWGKGKGEAKRQKPGGKAESGTVKIFAKNGGNFGVTRKSGKKRADRKPHGTRKHRARQKAAKEGKTAINSAQKTEKPNGGENCKIVSIRTRFSGTGQKKATRGKNNPNAGVTNNKGLKSSNRRGTPVAKTSHR